MYVQAALQWAIATDGLTQFLAANGACLIAHQLLAMSDAVHARAM
jgi:hypothetical protein